MLHFLFCDWQNSPVGYNEIMKVYRLLGEDELQLILDRNVSALGNYFTGRNSNTHKYKDRERYMHFFFNKDNCEYMKKVQGQEYKGEKKFIAEFDIPLRKIIGHIGKGFYVPKKGGYDYIYDSCYEIALPVSIFDASWIKRYELASKEVREKTPEIQPE